MKKRTPVKVNLKLTIPQFNNVRTIIKLSCSEIDQNNTDKKIQFGHILSFKIVNAGRNVDGLMSENKYLGIKPKFSTESSESVLAETYDTATLDLGVITNTGKIKLRSFVKKQLNT